MEEKKSDFIKSIAKEFAKEASPYAVIMGVYKKMFVRRISNPLLVFNIDDYPELQRRSYQIEGNKGQILQGYLYYYPTNKLDRLVVFAHGFGDGGHHNYLDVINYLASKGLCVFAYDATGNDESQGRSINGFPQGVIDLDTVINFVKKQPEFKKLPISLVGHSWGAYSVSAVLNKQKNIKNVVELSGFNKASDLMLAHGRDYVGAEADKFIPNVDNYDHLLFGKWADLTALEGFRKSTANIMIVHSEDDLTVPITVGYDVYYQEFKDNPRFTFIRYKDKGHGTVYNSKEGRQYLDSFRSKYKEFCKDTTKTEDDKRTFIQANMDRKFYCNCLDEELMNKVIEFVKQ